MIPQPGTPEFEAHLAWSTGEDERHKVRTGDGWQLGLYRYRAAGGSGPPVVLGHGSAGSRLIFDVDPEASLARFLARRGFDVWLVDLRGRNESWPPGAHPAELDWCFDDFVFSDLPAALGYVADHNPRPLAWIGTEMSGQLGYAGLISGTAAGVAALVTMGAPARTPPDAEVPGVTTAFPERVDHRVPFSMVREIGPVLAAQGSELLESSFRPSNTDWFVTARYFRHGVPDESTELADQFRDWIEHDTMRSRDRTTVWADRLGEIRVPTLVMVGAGDRQRPPAAVEATFSALGADDKRFVRAGKESGFSVDFGHDDLVAGRAASREVFPIVERWLREHVGS